MSSVQFFFFSQINEVLSPFCKVLKFSPPVEIFLSLDPSPTEVVAGHSSLTGP